MTLYELYLISMDCNSYGYTALVLSKEDFEKELEKDFTESENDD